MHSPLTAALSRVNVGEIPPPPRSANWLVDTNHVMLWLIATAAAIGVIVQGATLIYGWRRGKLGMIVRSEGFAHSVVGLVVLAGAAGIAALT